ncbi:hypothetical protein [Galbibacter sp.]|uniref:hypothetical protein n=1 Tax=Galbibacter sp. TaxID=2918471 RepID=UPI002D1FA6B0|nr:hypothetical protein [Galbibacter sp.]
MQTVGIIEFKKQAESAKQYFTQREQSIESWEFDDLQVTIKIDYKATLAVDLPNSGLKMGGYPESTRKIRI